MGKIIIKLKTQELKMQNQTLNHQSSLKRSDTMKTANEIDALIAQINRKRGGMMNGMKNAQKKWDNIDTSDVREKTDFWNNYWEMQESIKDQVIDPENDEETQINLAMLDDHINSKANQIDNEKLMTIMAISKRDSC